VEEWVPRLRQEKIEAAKRDLYLRLQHAKPRLKVPRRLWIEVLTNRPADDPIVNEWKPMKIEMGPKYTMNEVYHKVRSRWKDRWKIDWDEELMDPWKAWGQERLLDQDQSREWIDRERIMLLVQPRGGCLIEDMMNEEGFWDKFLNWRKWKKKEWLEWVNNDPDWERSRKEPEGWLPGEKQWFEEEDSWQEKIRRQESLNMKL
jgi:hypothetical protein